MRPGMVVYSKAGRDKGAPFIVLKCEGEYAYLTDGQSRPLNKPKKKKLKHIQPTNTTIEDIKHKIEHNLHIMDSDIVKALKSVKQP